MIHQAFLARAFLLGIVSALGFCANPASAWQSDNGDGTFNNPVMYADYPDPDVCRAGNDFYMVSTTFVDSPGIVVLHSKDMVNWEIVSHCATNLNWSSSLNMTGGSTAYRGGFWAGGIRYYNGVFYVIANPMGANGRMYYATNPAGPWQYYQLNQGVYDPSVFIDTDGKGYIVYGGVPNQSVAILNANFSQIVAVSNNVVNSGGEGSHMVKRGNYYYLFNAIPASRLVCSRSTNIFGPYETGHVCITASTGGHQGAIVDMPDGSDYGFVMKDSGSVGRMTYISPIYWTNGWPGWGSFSAPDRVPATATKPIQGQPVMQPASSDDFTNTTLGLQWQWNHNPDNTRWSLAERPGYLRLRPTQATNFWTARNTLTQKGQGSQSQGTVKFDLSNLASGDIAGFGTLGTINGQIYVIADSGGNKTLGMLVDDRQHSLTNYVTGLAFSGTTLYLRTVLNFQSNLGTCFYSPDGITWTRLGVNFPLAFDISVGTFQGEKFAIFCYNPATASSPGYLDVDSFTLNLPVPWLTQDIGSVGVTGSASLDNGLFTVAGAGADIWGTADAFRFAYLPVTGDCTIIARVTSVQNIDAWSKAGVMIRESLSAGSTHALMAMTPSNGVAFQYRSSTGGSSTNTNTTGYNAPYWVKLARSGSTFTGYSSSDGTTWTQQGSVSLAMASNAYIGLTVVSHVSSTSCTATFDNVIAPGWPPSAPPAAPASLTATAVSSTQINLLWNVFSNTATYNVKRSLANGGPYALIASGLTAPNYPDSGLVGGTIYYYVVSAVVGGNETPDSAQAMAATLSPTLGSLVHRYPFSESSGTSVADSVGGPVWTGALPNGGTFSAGQLTLSSGSSQYVLLPAGIMSPLSNFTIEVWAKLNTTASGNRLFDFGDSTSSYMFLTPYSGSTSTLRFGIRTPGNNEQDINGPNALGVGVWNHVAVTLNGNLSVLYLNGAAVGTNSYVTNYPSAMGNTLNNWLGRSEFSTTTYLDGVLDEFRIYNTGLSSAEIAATYVLGPDQALSTDSPPMSLMVTETNLVTSWPLANAGFALQSRTNLVLGNWVNMTSVVPRIIGGQWQAALPQPTDTGAVFYRLMK